MIKPPFCERCGLPFDGEITGSFECGNCREIGFSFSGARAAVVFDGIMVDVIRRYKYRREMWFEPFLAGFLVQEAVPILKQGKWDVIAPMPLHPVKRRERGFNQAERLAGHLSRASGLPLNGRLVQRVEPTPTQTNLSREERAANVKRAFAAGAERPGKGARVVLVDDVLTTGATTSACAAVLLTNGAKEVCVWTVARGL